MPRITINSSSATSFWKNRLSNSCLITLNAFVFSLTRSEASKSSHYFVAVGHWEWFFMVIPYHARAPLCRGWMDRARSNRSSNSNNCHLLYEIIGPRGCAIQNPISARLDRIERKTKKREARVDIVHCGTSQSCLPYRTSEYTINPFRKPPVDVSRKKQNGEERVRNRTSFWTGSERYIETVIHATECTIKSLTRISIMSYHRYRCMCDKCARFFFNLIYRRDLTSYIIMLLKKIYKDYYIQIQSFNITFIVLLLYI